MACAAAAGMLQCVSCFFRAQLVKNIAHSHAVCLTLFPTAPARAAAACRRRAAAYAAASLCLESAKTLISASDFAPPHLHPREEMLTSSRSIRWYLWITWITSLLKRTKAPPKMACFGPYHPRRRRPPVTTPGALTPMARDDARCVRTVAADSAALIWDASAPFFIFDRPFLVSPR